MRTFVLAAALALTLTQTAHAEQRMIGDWILKSEADAFSDKATNTIAMRMNDGMQLLAVRCLDGELSLALGGPKYRDGDIFFLKFRADKGEVIDTEGKAISEAVLQVVTKPEMIKQMMSAHRYALRVMGDTQMDFIFRAGRGAERAIGEVVKACPLDKAE